MTIKTAKDCFQENGERFTDPRELEKLNLYKGLYHLAEAIEQMQQKIDAIERQVQAIRR